MRSRVALVAAVALVLAPSALAHPQAQSSRPAPDAVLDTPPLSVSITFSESVDPVGEGIVVYGPSGEIASTAAAKLSGDTLTRVVDARERGSYLVRWTVVGDDTHPARGAFLFSVGERTRTGVPGEGRTGIGLQALARWLSVLGVALGFGIPALALLALDGAMRSREWRLAGAGVGLMLVAEPIGLIGQTATLAPGSSLGLDLAGDVLRTSYGHTAGLRLGVALGLWALLGATRSSGRRGLVAITALGAAACLVEAASMHGLASLPGWVGLVIGAAHVGGACAWLAAIVLVVAGIPVARLASAAAGAVMIAGASGVGLALGHLGTVGDLLTTGYGLTLSVKVTLAAVALGLGLVARRRSGARRLELAVAAVVAGLGAVLATLVPPL